MIKVISEIDEIRAYVARERFVGRRICLVPTMGALHEGHLSLVRLALEHGGYVVVSIFVNPSQFGPTEDFGRYPRRLSEDAVLLESAGAHIVFAPDADAMYPKGFATWVTVEGLTEGLCGRTRPTHFRGVATVVTKLFTIVRPDTAVFGRKDAQQLAVIRRMTRDLELGVEIVAAPIVRERDGLAMSSRNAYLTPEERGQATVLYRALEQARNMARSGVTGAPAISEAIRKTISGSPLARIDYVEIVDPDTMTPVDDVSEGAIAALAVYFGTTRLIDNADIGPSVK